MRNRPPRFPGPNAVEPIRRRGDLDKIRNLLAIRARDTLLFELAIATGMQAKQLLQLQVRDLKAMSDDGGAGSTRNTKRTGNNHRLPHEALEAIDNYLTRFSPPADHYVFKSRKGNKPLTISSASRLVSGWFQKAGLTGLRGLLSLRMTFEFHYVPPVGGSVTKPRAAQPKYEIEKGLAPVRTLTLTETVYKELERMIVSGQIPPGARLVAGQLSRQMQVSTIPVREALARLEARDFVTRTPQKGFVVNKRSVNSILELLEIRLILESAALKKAVNQIQPETVVLLEEANKLYVSAWKAWQVDEMLKAAKKFHDLLYRDADIPVLKKMIDQVWDGINPYYHIMFKQQKGPRHSGAPYHQKMIEGIRAGDIGQVIDWLTRDMNDAMAYVSETLTKIISED